MDAQAYHEAGMDLNQIYIINKHSDIRCLDRQKISARGSGRTIAKRHKELSFLVDTSTTTLLLTFFPLQVEEKQKKIIIVALFFPWRSRLK